MANGLVILPQGRYDLHPPVSCISGHASSPMP